jgi:hypothetical protein
VCNPSGYGEGEQVLGAQSATTNADGTVAFTVTLAIEVPAGQFVTATATDPGNNTSQFSACQVVSAGNLPGVPALRLAVLPQAQNTGSAWAIAMFPVVPGQPDLSQIAGNGTIDLSPSALSSLHEPGAPAMESGSPPCPTSPFRDIPLLVGLATRADLEYNPLPLEEFA